MKQATFLLFFLTLVWSQAGTIFAQTNGDIRLVDGSSSSSGRLEIYLKGTWGSVCYNEVSMGAAQAACKQLGFSDAEQVDTVEKMGLNPGTGPTHLNDVYCSLNSGYQHILRCSFSQVISDSCKHTMDMAITCSSSPLSPYDTAVRLVDGGTGFPSSGIAEIYLHNQWGTMCDYEITETEASTICQQLSYTSSTNQLSAKSSKKVWLDAGSISCNTDQQCLDVCSIFIYPPADYSASCYEVAVVNCTFDISEKDYNFAGSESLCTNYLYLVNNLQGIIIGGVIAFIFVCLIFILVPIIICCCCIQGCLLYNYRERRVVYQVIQ